MKSSWEKIKMRKIADLNPYKITKEFRFETIEYLDISSVGSGYITKPKIMKLSEAPSRAKRLVNDGNIILSTVRPNRRSFYFFKHAKDNLVVSTGFAVLQAKKKVIPKFLYYLINDYKFTGYLTKSAKGSAYPAVDEEIINNAILSIPKELKEQRKITSILSAYDELIENNNRRIGILEEMAETIYKEWFVHFRYPGHEKDKMIDSELGKIPEGWEVKFKDYVDFLEGPGLRRRQYREKGIPFLNIRTLNNNEIDFTKVNFIDEKEVSEHYNHFLLLENDHVVSSSGTIGRVVTIRENHLPLLLNTSIIRMRPKNSRVVGKWFLKHFLKSMYFQGQIRAYAIGSAQINYGPSHLKRMWLILPTENISKLYEDIVTPLEEQIKNN